jgi:phosphoglycerate dehydrogenase-like enzyme
MDKILLYEKPCDKAMKILSENFELVDSKQDGIVGAFVKLKGLTSSMIPLNLKFIGCPCTDISHIPTTLNGELYNYSIAGTTKILHLDSEWKSNKGLSITSTAEHTISLMLQIAKLKQIQLSGKRLGVIGLGRIGRQVYHLGMALGMDVSFYDNKCKPVDCDCNLECYGIVCESFIDFGKILRESDIISIHVPLNYLTHNMINCIHFAHMKDGVIIVNTSRPEVIDEKELAISIVDRKIWYTSDFYPDNDEPRRHHLWLDTQICFIEQNGNAVFPVIQTPHVGGNSIEAREATDIYIANKMVDYWKGINNG